MKAEMEDMKKLLQMAVDYDKRTNQHHCEMEEKVAVLKQLAKIFDIDLKDIFEH